VPRPAESAPAKINLFLHVGEKRPDGFHGLESLVVFARAGDVLTFEESGALSLVLEGPFAKGLETESDNLVLRAARALGERTGRAPAARITLTKNLPVSSGIGGGSADCAAALRGLVQLWGAKTGQRDLHAIAESLGSDVPVCLVAKTSWMEGRGERVTPAPSFAPLAAVLVNPGVAVPTGPVFAALKSRSGVDHAKPAGWSSQEELIAYLKSTRNDLEAPARELAPEISDVLYSLAACEGIRLARMSGSGATCFGLFTNASTAESAAGKLKKAYPSWWVMPTLLG
jgi:4-diphosphocytidyl-2-C-methyl-D-erythritol kinase